MYFVGILMPGDPATQTPTTVVMAPSCSGGIGHISRCSALAKALVQLDPTVQIEMVLDAERLRPFNIEATIQMGFRPRLFAARTRESRDGIVRACFSDADIIVDDVARYLLPYRQLVPHAAWVSILMHPVGDELFLDWPFMAQMDGLIWPYAPLMEMPKELSMVEDKVLQTGPFLHTAHVPDQAACRVQLGRTPSSEFVLYASRGFPFGREFGHRVLSSIYNAVATLRATSRPGLELVVLAVQDPSELLGISEIPSKLPEWVHVQGVVTPAQSLIYTKAASVVIAEGTSTMHEAAALCTPLLLVPGPIQEATLLAQCLARAKAGDLVDIDDMTAQSVATVFQSILAGGAARSDMMSRAHDLVTSGGGVMAAARFVLQMAERQKTRRHIGWPGSPH